MKTNIGFLDNFLTAIGLARPVGDDFAIADMALATTVLLTGKKTRILGVNSNLKSYHTE
jgi:hypothetical protein